MILDTIAEATRLRIQKNKEQVPPAQMAGRAAPSPRPFAFEKAIRQKDIAFICEVKKASPSKGVIAQDFPYVRIAEEYRDAGAAAISVLTEPQFFLGRDEYLAEIRQAVSIPLLRKDFILDEYQIYESAAMGADAILLICALLETSRLRDYMGIADSLGLSCLVETHSRNEIASAVTAGARIIGINNRDLRTFAEDVQTSVRLRPYVPEGVLLVSESGIRTPDDVAALQKVGANAVLVGETLMRSPDKKRMMEQLRGARHG